MKSVNRGIHADGFNAYGKMFEPEVETDSEAAMREAIDNPAWGCIMRFLANAQALGFDPRDPDIIRRATAAGEKAFAAQPPPPTSVVGTVHNHDSVVYYMQLGELVKIGFTTNIITRVSSLNPERVLAVERGGRDVETERHREFATSRRHGEWFTVTPELRRHIQAVRDRFEEASGLTLDAWLARPSQRGKPPTSSASTVASSPTGPAPITSNHSAASASVDPS